MALLFGNRPFDFTDFFSLIMDGKIDLSNLNYLDVMKNSVEAGFKHIEITGDLPYVLPGLLTPEEIERLVEFKKKEKITYSIHLPLWGQEPAAFSEHIRDGSVRTFVECIELTKPLDPICWVMHPTGALTVEFLNMNLPDFTKGLIVSQFCSYAEDSIRKLIEYADIAPEKIAVENIEFPFESMEPIIDELGLSICFDTGHLLAGFSGEISVMDFIEKYIDRLAELHLHDGAKPRIDHKSLGKHDLPVRELLLELQKKNFKGPLVYELTLQDALDSMNYIKKHIPEVLK
ncbi:MAG: sugar phosphate isomerase/epimerase [Candidatus Heimdallarchaeota archaeon]|nr:sugar phosphate isomerase/epimerase [Candidatus Heimdallarchaeota archaeon]